MPTAPFNHLTVALNSWGARFGETAGRMLLQSMVVAVVLLGVAWACSRTRAAFRYALLMLIPVKLLLPPSLSFPTGWAYWLQTPIPHTQSQPPRVAVINGVVQANRTEPAAAPALSRDAVILLVWVAGVGVLAALILGRYRKVARLKGTPASAEWQRELDACRARMGVRRSLRLETSSTCASPAVCGLFRPVILIPTALAEKLTPQQLRHVLLHELAHVRRGDLRVNHLQVILQVLHWFNPFLWWANAVIRRVREEAVDDLVMARLGAEAPSYPATLVSVARMAFARPALGLGFIGVMESKAALKRRLTRLVRNPVAPVELGWARTGVILAMAAVLLPMARPSSSDKATGQEQPGAETGSRGEAGSGIDLPASIRSEFVRALQAQGITYQHFHDKFVGNRVLKPGEMEDIARKWLADQKSAPTSSTPNTVAGIMIRHIGPATVPDEQIRARIGTKAGAPVNRSQVDADVRSLYATGFFYNVRVVEERNPKGTVLVYVLQEKPRLNRIAFEGNTKVSDQALHEKLASRVGEPLDERTVFNDAQALHGIYQRLGLPDTVVKYKITNDEKTGRSAVTFEIKEKVGQGSHEAPDRPTAARRTASEGNVNLWDVAHGRKLESLPVNTNGAPLFAFSPDGRVAATGQTIRIWDASGKAITTAGAHSNAIISVTFSPDGRMVAGGKPIKLWDLNTGKEIIAPEAQSNIIRWANFSPDGERLITFNGKSTRLWEIVSGVLSHGTNSATGSSGKKIQTQAGIMSDPQLRDPSTVTGIKDDPQLRK
jgi:beta-lactamase regulating signal transducer with metallopeptidase domain/WD40 repeat protein